MHIHFLGIAGTLMGSLALLARAAGHEVTGSDQQLYPPMSTQLADAGIDVHIGWEPTPLKQREPDLVVVGNANLPRGNPALEYVLDRNLRYTSGAQWLGEEILAGRWTIAVSGTHGKTTTTAMISWILAQARLDPGFLIGGVPANFPQSSHLGGAPFFVVEADEYDTSYFDRRAKFAHYRPRTLVINNLEYDHADIYPDLAAIQNQFALLLRAVPANGLIIAPADSDAIEGVLAQGCWTAVERIHSVDAEAVASGGWSAAEFSADGDAFTVYFDGAPQGRLEWGLLGRHNVQNALAAIAAARHAGVPAAVAIEALCQFRGVKRRMERIGHSARISVYDDFAHHPTAIASTLEGLRAAVGEEEIVAVIEPRSHTMSLGSLAAALDTCTAAADQALWKRTDRLQWDISAFEENPTTPTRVLEDSEAILRVLKEMPAPTNGRRRHIVLMSNSAFDGIHPRVVEALCEDA